MKRFLKLLVALSLILVFAACGNVEEEIENKLEGTWTDSTFKLEYVFEDGKYFPSFRVGEVQVPGKEGTYEIDFQEEVIIVTFDEGNQVDFKYTYEDGKLSLKSGSTDLIKKY